MHNIYVFTLGLGLSLLSQQARAQAQLAADSSAQTSTALGSLRQHYTQGLGADSRLYNGAEYVDYVRYHVNGHQFFGAKEQQRATLEYGGATYEQVPLRYDIVKDKLVLQAPSSMLDMTLTDENVRRFRIGTHQFVRLVAADTAGATLPRTGYYELLVAEGTVQLLALRRKDLQETAAAGRLVGNITQKNDFYLFHGRRYYKLTKASTVVGLFPEHKAALRKHIRTRKLSFAKDRRETSLVELVRYAVAQPATAK
ncbi:hypothetical protein LGH70_12905 [Hymenobacter sp. BT635]|uniref:YARHG domain-containing protein n=1 Tax=Hymenobacter nitidus TaxID=2880929 RepID=A0ABS8AFJ9_9BACT|nr:hypothetical protein [Hymenobacter nitidus]MCB2378492.1 hypothetical protein [Hymenobacter nitidus]